MQHSRDWQRAIFEAGPWPTVREIEDLYSRDITLADGSVEGAAGLACELENDAEYMQAQRERRHYKGFRWSMEWLVHLVRTSGLIGRNADEKTARKKSLRDGRETYKLLRRALRRGDIWGVCYFAFWVGRFAGRLDDCLARQRGAKRPRSTPDMEQRNAEIWAEYQSLRSAGMNRDQAIHRVSANHELQPGYSTSTIRDVIRAKRATPDHKNENRTVS